MGRPLRGSRLASFYTSDTEAEPTAPPSLSTLDSAFQLQEYIGALVRLNPHDIERIVKVPGVNTTAIGEEKEKDAAGEDERVSVDEACWIYEQLRRLAQDLTHPLITMLQQECTRKTCPEMKAGEWLYLCVAHGNSGAMEHCCAIDYIVHTLDSATALLNSPRAFPSRISIPQTSHRHFPSLARRLGRIFAHAYHHHRLAFESAEAESALYARFLSLSRHFDLVPAEFLVIPERNAQAEEDVGRGQRDVGRKEITLLTRHHEEAASLPGPTTSSSAHSPRIGGRARTDTMYFSGGYVSPHKGDSPDVSTGRLPDTTDTALAADGSQAQQETASTSAQEVAEETVTQEETGDDGLAQPATDSVAEQASDSTVPGRIPGQVFARDFALEPPPPAIAPEPTENIPDTAPGDDAASQAVSEDTAGTADTADIDKEQEDPPAVSLDAPADAPADAPESTSPDADNSAVAPIESSEPAPTPLPAEPAVADDLVFVGPSTAEITFALADESAVVPDPDVPEVVSADLSKDDEDAGAGAAHEDEEVGEPEDEVKGDEAVAEVETLTEVDEASTVHAETSVLEDEAAQVSSGGT